MKKGDVVMIYEDPITEKKPEGRAQIIQWMGRDNDGIVVTRTAWVFFEETGDPPVIRKIRDHEAERKQRSARIRKRLESSGLYKP